MRSNRAVQILGCHAQGEVGDVIKLDRSPTDTGVSARMAVLHGKGLLAVGDTFRGLSANGTRFNGRIEATSSRSGIPPVIHSIQGWAWLTETKQPLLDTDDPFPGGYRVGDTWPGATGAPQSALS